jgi:hypothetical protein
MICGGTSKTTTLQRFLDSLPAKIMKLKLNEKAQDRTLWRTQLAQGQQPEVSLDSGKCIKKY